MKEPNQLKQIQQIASVLKDQGRLLMLLKPQPREAIAARGLVLSAVQRLEAWLASNQPYPKKAYKGKR